MKASLIFGALIAAIIVPSTVCQSESSSKSSEPPSTTTESSSKIDDPTSTTIEPSSTSSDAGPAETGKAGEGIENYDMLSKGRVDGGVTDDFYWSIQGHNATNDLRRVGAIEPIQLIIDTHDFNNCTLIVGCKKTKGNESYIGLITSKEFKRGDPWYWRPCENPGEGEMNTGFTIDYYVAYCL